MLTRYCSRGALLAFELLTLGAFAEILLFSGERTLLASVVVAIYVFCILIQGAYSRKTRQGHGRAVTLLAGGITLGSVHAYAGWSWGTALCLVGVFVAQGSIGGRLPKPHLFAVFSLAILGGILSERDLLRHLLLAGEEPSDLLLFPISIVLALLTVCLFSVSSPQERGATKGWGKILESIVLGVVLIGSWYVLLHQPLQATVQLSSDAAALIGTFIAFFGVLKILPPHVFSDRMRVACTFSVVVAVVGLLLHAERTPGSSPCGPPPEPYLIPTALYVQLLAAEDPIFLQHGGVDFYRLRRAAREFVLAGTYGRGGSTLTMQLAKVCFLSEEKTLLRKLDQIVRARELEYSHEKGELFYWYLESVPFAPGVRGVQAASRFFYGVPPDQLTSDQVLALIQTIFDPAEFSPNTQVIPKKVRLRSAVIRGLGRRYCDKLVGDLFLSPDIKVQSRECV